MCEPHGCVTFLLFGITRGQNELCRHVIIIQPLTTSISGIKDLVAVGTKLDSCAVWTP